MHKTVRWCSDHRGREHASRTRTSPRCVRERAGVVLASPALRSCAIRGLWRTVSCRTACRRIATNRSPRVSIRSFGAYRGGGDSRDAGVVGKLTVRVRRRLAVTSVDDAPRPSSTPAINATRNTGPWCRPPLHGRFSKRSGHQRHDRDEQPDKRKADSLLVGDRCLSATLDLRGVQSQAGRADRPMPPRGCDFGNASRTPFL